MKPQLFFIACLLFLFSCREKSKYPYAICDFDRVFQPYLTAIVNINVVGFDSATHFVTTRMNNEGLFKLSLSEHPVLRATALRELVHRKSVDQLQVLIGHLDDTASIIWDRGEWGVKFRSVSDDMIKTTAFRDSAVRAVLIDSVMKSHIYLNSVYKILNGEFLPEKYHQMVRQLSKFGSPEGSEMALTALFAYHQQADIPFIDSLLLSHSAGLTRFGLKIIEHNPDTVFLQKLETIILWRMYRNEKDHFYSSSFTPQQYFFTVAAFKNKRSAALLTSILHRKPILPTLQDTVDFSIPHRKSIRPILSDTVDFKEEVCDAILANRCPAYDMLIREMSGYITKLDSLAALPSLYIPLPAVDDPSARIIRW